MTQDKAFRQNEYENYNLPKESWGLYLDFDNHDLKDYIKYKDKVEWIEFYKCGEGYWGTYYNKNLKKRKSWFKSYDRYTNIGYPIKNLKLLKFFTNVKDISAYNKTGLTYGQQKEIHKIIKKRKLNQRGVLWKSREYARYDRRLSYLNFKLDEKQIAVYYRGNGRYKFSIQRNYITPKFGSKDL